MASIKRSLSAKTDQAGKSEILLRLSIDRNNKYRLKSGYFIKPSRFRDGEIIMPRANRKEADELSQLENNLINLERYILTLCREENPANLSKEFFIEAIDDYKFPKSKEDNGIDIYNALNEYINVSGLSTARLNHYRVLCRTLARFQAIRAMNEPNFKLTFEVFDESLLAEFVKFIKDEPDLFEKYPEIYDAIPVVTRTLRKPKKPLPRGGNTISCELKRLRAFFNWSIKKGYTKNYPFEKFKIVSEKYGTPFYLTIEERNQIAEHDFTMFKALEKQRDIFIFQCLIGCRVSDLYGLTTDSIIDDAIEYIPAKTKTERPEVIRVPLNPQAKDLIRKYSDRPDKRLFPFISPQKYNDAIKEIIRLSGIDRIVTIMDSVTGEEVKRPIYEVASSHMARRTFIGNLYKKVKDPNLVGSLSGHKEGSKAFARYREIDDDIKKELINLL